VTRLSLRLVGSAVVLLSIGIATGCASDRQPTPTSSVSELKKKYPRQIDLAKARAACLQQKGWPVTLDEQGAIALALPDGKEAEYNSDDLACLKELGADPDSPTPKSVVAWQYKAFLKAAKCLRKAGWQVTVEPTLQTFEDTYETDPWIPWDQVPTGDLIKSYELCPPPKPGY
jgi:hypothetical protein